MLDRKRNLFADQTRLSSSTDVKEIPGKVISSMHKLIGNSQTRPGTLLK
jgi:hypothetical protein